MNVPRGVVEKEVAAQDSILVPCDNAYRGIPYQCWLVHRAMDLDLHRAGVMVVHGSYNIRQ